MPPNLGTERSTVQDPMIGYAVEIGWGYLSPDEALTLRRGESGTLLYPTLRDKLIALNPGVVTIDNVDQVIASIESVRNTIEGNAEMLAWLRGERSVYVQNEKRQRNVILIDFEHPAQCLPRDGGVAIHQRTAHESRRCHVCDQRHPPGARGD